MLSHQLGRIARGRALQQLYCSWALTDITTRVKLEGMDEGIQGILAVEQCVTLGCSTDLEVELHTLVKRWPSLQVAGIAHASSLEENGRAMNHRRSCPSTAPSAGLSLATSSGTWCARTFECLHHR